MKKIVQILMLAGLVAGLTSSATTKCFTFEERTQLLKVPFIIAAAHLLKTAITYDRNDVLLFLREMGDGARFSLWNPRLHLVNLFDPSIEAEYEQALQESQAVLRPGIVAGAMLSASLLAYMLMHFSRGFMPPEAQCTAKLIQTIAYIPEVLAAASGFLSALQLSKESPQSKFPSESTATQA